MKIYAGPFKEKSYEKQLSPVRSIDRHDVYTSYDGSQTFQTVYGIIPGDVEIFYSLYAPKFRELVADDWVIQCPYRKERTNWTANPCTLGDDTYVDSPIRHYSGRYTNTCAYAQEPFLFDPPYGLVTQRAAAADEALSRVFAKANTRNADLLIELTQLKDTIRMFVTLGRRLIALAMTPGAILNLPEFLARTARSNKNRRVKAYPVKLYRWLDELAGLWCEMRFGWRPLLSSLDGVVEALKSPETEAKRVTYRALEQVSINKRTEKAYQSTATPGYPLIGTKVLSTETRHEASYRAGILLSEKYDLAQKLGLSYDQIPIAVWDLIPYSFIVDRFVNVGNWIRSLRPIGITEFGGAWLVERYTTTYVFRADYLAVDQSVGSESSYARWIRAEASDAVRCEITGVVRSIHSAPPSLPTIRWDASSINDLFNAVDGVMLAIQRLLPTISRKK